MPRTTSSPARRPPSRPRSVPAKLTVAEMSKAISDKPHLAAKIISLRDDKRLDRERRMEEIAKVVREDERSVADRSLAETASHVPTALEAAQAAWRPTSAQLDGARAAALEQRQRLEAAEAHRIDKPIGRVWSSFGGEAIIEGGMLDHVDLVDARWLIALHEHGGVVPRWQDVPSSARVTAGSAWRLWGWERMFSLGILVLS